MEKQYLIEKKAVLQSKSVVNNSSISNIYDEAFRNGCIFVANNEWVDIDGNKWSKWNYGACEERDDLVELSYWYGNKFSKEEMVIFCNTHNVRIPTLEEIERLHVIAYFNISGRGKHYRQRIKIGEVVIPCNAPIWVYDNHQNQIKRVTFYYRGDINDYNIMLEPYHYMNEHVMKIIDTPDDETIQGHVHFILN